MIDIIEEEVLVLDGAPQRLRAQPPHDAPVREDQGTIGQLPGLSQAVGDQDDGTASPEGQDQLLYRVRRGPVQRGGRLIQQEQFRVQGQGARQTKPLLLPAGQARRRGVQPVRHLVPEPDLLETWLRYQAIRMSRYRTESASESSSSGAGPVKVLLPRTSARVCRRKYRSRTARTETG